MERAVKTTSTVLLPGTAHLPAIAVIIINTVAIAVAVGASLA